MGSTRLPGKSMMELAGEPLVGRILERVKRCRRIDEIVLAIPDTGTDSVLGDLGRRYGVTLFAGSENDLVERYYQAGLVAKADIVGRLPADNATPEPEEIDRIADFHRALGRRGFSSNLTQVGDNRYPDGIGAEMFDFSLLAEARERHGDPRQREHVHLNFFDYSTQTPVDAAWCPITTVPCPQEFARPDLVLDVNTAEQYAYMHALYAALYPRNPNFHITDIIVWHDTVWKSSRIATGAHE
jgi:spore coat polysaccharide biosynthesis protein SpsF